MTKIKNLIQVYRMNILELFSGTGSIGKVAIDFGHHVISLDKDMEADIKTDILDWDYKACLLYTSPSPRD